MKNILEALEASAARLPNKTAFADEDTALTFGQTADLARRVGSGLLAALPVGKNRPVCVYLPKTPACLAAMWGVTYSGNFYVVLDVDMPPERVKTILETLRPAALVADAPHRAAAGALAGEVPVLDYEALAAAEQNLPALQKVRAAAVDTDPLYALFTSGSTGVPKGAVVGHKNVLAYTAWVADTFAITEETIWGSQTPFYFSMSVTDVYSTVLSGATLQILPKSYFSFPLKLMELMEQRAVNTIYWVPSALCILANWKALDYAGLPHLRQVLFAGEVMPTKQLNYWRAHLPEVKYANLFGPTETTDICTYYKVERPFDDAEPLPIGHACDNCDCFLVNEQGRQAAPGESGELYVRGSFVALGYYNNPAKTAEAFVQNPLQTAYPETVYRTGDLARYNVRGELIYQGRKDFQIKHMGYRIELGEIEAAVSAVDKIKSCVCLYDTAEERIVLVYEAVKLSADDLMKAVAGRLPAYMQPNVCIRAKQMPVNANGKIDRSWLKNNYKTL